MPSEMLKSSSNNIERCLPAQQMLNNKLSSHAKACAHGVCVCKFLCTVNLCARMPACFAVQLWMFHPALKRQMRIHRQKKVVTKKQTGIYNHKSTRARFHTQTPPPYTPSPRPPYFKTNRLRQFFLVTCGPHPSKK